MKYLYMKKITPGKVFIFPDYVDCNCIRISSNYLFVDFDTEEEWQKFDKFITRLNKDVRKKVNSKL